MKTILRINGLEVMSLNKGVLNINPGESIKFFDYECRVISRDKFEGNIIIEAQAKGFKGGNDEDNNNGSLL